MGNSFPPHKGFRPCIMYILVLPSNTSEEKPPWRNRLARSAVNRKVGGSSPPGGALFLTKEEREIERESVCL